MNESERIEEAVRKERIKVTEEQETLHRQDLWAVAFLLSWCLVLFLYATPLVVVGFIAVAVSGVKLFGLDESFRKK